ncbi:antitoxin component HigA of HigAB toxin-antitoxin module [Lactobacillus colini]|uniref:Antitoxin component HigA of HigAB toxin-antitoxin module n=1 Tax=Lactobacillus colini TaxID=1819254 RepID=A0ABS4MG24_9LACO|nr:hypothetical protein [Lactobacillus colini]MBP2058309.1 antitoxin component HigA of HigAB toxin-antitoxin module [Lactobacillus colini]
MTIGEALISYTNDQTAANITSQATYSKVINNKQHLTSELLAKLLFYRDIDINSFYERLKKHLHA